MNEQTYRFEFSPQVLDCILRALNDRPHGEVRGVIDGLLQARLQQDKERDEPLTGEGIPLKANGQASEGVAA